MVDLKIGADPELFIRNKKDGKLISADGLFEGTKENPFPVHCGAVQVDGMAAEYNIIPATNQKEFVAHNVVVLNELRKTIKKNNPTLDFEFEFSPVAAFGAEYIAEQREEARRLGCTPDFNAYEGGIPNPTPNADLPFRTASGHIHVGWGSEYDINDPEHIEACCMMTKQLDCFLMGILTIEGKEGAVRRELYGKAGAFRPKSYGVEYRVPSNVWLKDLNYMRLMFQNTQMAFNELMNGLRSYEGVEGSYAYDIGRSAQAIINKHEAKLYTRNYGTWKAADWDKSPVSTKNLPELVAYYKRNAKPAEDGPDMIPEEVFERQHQYAPLPVLQPVVVRPGDPILPIVQGGVNDMNIDGALEGGLRQLRQQARVEVAPDPFINDEDMDDEEEAIDWDHNIDIVHDDVEAGIGDEDADAVAAGENAAAALEAARG